MQFAFQLVTELFSPQLPLHRTATVKSFLKFCLLPELSKMISLPESCPSSQQPPPLLRQQSISQHSQRKVDRLHLKRVPSVSLAFDDVLDDSGDTETLKTSSAPNDNTAQLREHLYTRAMNFMECLESVTNSEAISQLALSMASLASHSEFVMDWHLFLSYCVGEFHNEQFRFRKCTQRSLKQCLTNGITGTV